MVDLLVLIKPLIEVTLSLRVGPQHVPVVTIGGHQIVDFEQEAHEL